MNPDRLPAHLRDLPPDLHDLVEAVRDPAAGFFGPGSASWRHLRENTLQLAGPAAALMQVAHPMVARGVADHSNFRGDPIGRLERTFVAVHRIVFGPVDKALEAALGTRRMHATVRGELDRAAGPSFPCGAAYEANRSDLLMWVHATLVDGAIDANERFGGPLPREERGALYEEMKISARLFGVPRETLPPTYDDFVDYHRGMVEHTLFVTDAAREIADAIVWRAGYYRAVSPLVLLLAAGLLPPVVREQFRLPWNRAMELALGEFEKRWRQARYVLPPRLLFRSAYLRGVSRTGSGLPRVAGRPLDPLWSRVFG
jgi:uncharacterized protein (DUF2236 family)